MFKDDLKFRGFIFDKDIVYRPAVVVLLGTGPDERFKTILKFSLTV